MLFDLRSLAPENCYKLVTATVVPRPIAWVVSLSPDGRVNMAPFSFFNAFGAEPPVVGIGVGSRIPGTPKDTRGNIARSGEFVVNLVPFASAEQMNVTAIDFAPEVDELATAGLTPVASTLVAPPRIAESPVAMECELLQIVPLGAVNSLVLGRVLAMHVQDEAVLDAERCHIDTPKLDLIGRMHGRGWYTRTGERFEIPRIPVEQWRGETK